MRTSGSSAEVCQLYTVAYFVHLLVLAMAAVQFAMFAVLAGQPHAHTAELLQTDTALQQSRQAAHPAHCMS